MLLKNTLYVGNTYNNRPTCTHILMEEITKIYIYIGGMYIYTDTFVYVEYMYNSGSI